ncbi:hypothetical protein [Hyphomicrobium sp.]|uniref:hypothetical protein n=1 Tax=Hyphomicrobium sp. TaxID=82 RepID=UPI0025BDAA36|nr:hypothetical protein [Hyphomicrobium sp.]MCC7253708.1 hypothetical protein [Hyphomicrobium sp.]
MVSLIVCFLFYATLATRIWPFIRGRSSLFKRTEQESAVAAQTSIFVNAYDEARVYCKELPHDHPLVSVVDIRQAILHRDFDSAYASIERFVNRSRRANKIEDQVTLDSREKWFVLSMQANALADGMTDLDFMLWSIGQPYVQERDVAKFIVTRSLHGGVSQVTAFAHYLHMLLEGKGARYHHFRDAVVSGFLLGSWKRYSSSILGSKTFDVAIAQILEMAVQHDRAIFVLAGSPLYRTAPPEYDAMAFGEFLVMPNANEFADMAHFVNLEGVDRAYILDTLFTQHAILSRSSNPEQRDLAQKINATIENLQSDWGERVFERLGIDNEMFVKTNQLIGSVLTR